MRLPFSSRSSSPFVYFANCCRGRVPEKVRPTLPKPPSGSASEWELSTGYPQAVDRFGIWAELPIEMRGFWKRPQENPGIFLRAGVRCRATLWRGAGFGAPGELSLLLSLCDTLLSRKKIGQFCPKVPYLVVGSIGTTKNSIFFWGTETKFSVWGGSDSETQGEGARPGKGR